MTIVVGGGGRKAGKTALVESLIRAFPQAGWLAVKISGHSHGARGAGFHREESASAETDTGRFLAAGAREAWWVQCEPESLPAALPRLVELTGRFENVVIESNSIVEWIRPDLYVFVERGAVKDSAERWRQRADLVVSGVPASVPPGLARWLQTRLGSQEE